MGDQLRVNGNIVSYGSIKAKIDSDLFVGFTSIGFAHKRERTFVYGMTPDQAPRARTRGKYTAEPIKLKGPKSTFQAMRQALAAKSGDGRSYGDVEFPVVLQLIEQEESHTIEFDRCVFTGASNSFEEGAEALMEEVELSCFHIIEDGLTLFSGVAL
jgi:hypothetical protein